MSEKVTNMWVWFWRWIPWEGTGLAYIRGLRLDPPLPLALALGLTLGAKGLGAEPSPNVTQFFRGFLIADSWESQGNPPSTPAPVIRPSMCQSSPTRWQARDDMTIVRPPLFAARTSQTQENIPVIMAFQCQLACRFWPETSRLTMERQHVFRAVQSLSGEVEVFGTQVFSGIRWKLVCGSKPSDHIYILEASKKNMNPWLRDLLKKKKKSYTSEHTRQLECKLRWDLNVGRKCMSCKQSLVKVHTLKMVFSIFHPSGGNPFSGHSHISTLEKRGRETERERERERGSSTSDNPLAWKWAPQANKFREKITVLRVCVNMHVKR